MFGYAFLLIHNWLIEVDERIGSADNGHSGAPDEGYYYQLDQRHLGVGGGGGGVFSTMRYIPHPLHPTPNS